MIFNEPLSVLGHILTGIHSRYGPHLVEALKSIHHINLACAEAGRRMRSVLGDDARIGTTNVFTVAAPFEHENEKLRRSQDALEALLVGAFVDPPGGLGYPFEATRILRPMQRWIEDGDLDDVVFDYDFMGVQYYGPIPFRRSPIPGFGGFPVPSLKDAEINIKSAVGLPVEPKGLLEVLRRYKDHPACKHMVITESGFGAQDRMVDGRIRDDVRIWYLRQHLDAVLQAQAEGIEVGGFFHWSYADNIEWVLGQGPRFGLFHVDYENDFARTPKDSAHWFRALLTEADGVD
jgi:beta-glucosidase